MLPADILREVATADPDDRALLGGGSTDVTDQDHRFSHDLLQSGRRGDASARAAALPR
jgi:hypothetical protein